MSRAQEKQGREARKILAVVFGTGNKFVVLVLLLLFLFSWAADGVISALLEWQYGDLMGLVLFVGYLLWLLHKARAFTDELRPFVDENLADTPKRVLILFLSDPGSDFKAREDDSPPEAPGDAGWLSIPALVETLSLKNRSDINAFNASWRMPMEAIAHHRIKLEKIVIVPSADRVLANGQTSHGTHTMAELFVQTVTAMWKDTESQPRFDIRAEGKGINYESADQLLEEIYTVYKGLKKDYTISEVILDVTSGTKPCSFAGTTAALGMDRLVQYVYCSDGENYRIKYYDVNYEEPEGEG